MVAVGGEGFGALFTGVPVWFRFWLIFCASEEDDVVILPPNFGATAGGLVKGWALGLVLALSSSAQGAGGGRSPISGGGRKERAGLGAVGGAAGGLGGGADEY